MDWTEFVASERGERSPWVLMLDESHLIRLTTADVGKYYDNGLRKDGKFVQGGIMNHRKPDGGTCGGYVNFALLINPSEREKSQVKWEVHSLDPLTLTPSLLCHCGEHGWITDGKWVPA